MTQPTERLNDSGIETKPSPPEDPVRVLRSMLRGHTTGRPRVLDRSDRSLAFVRAWATSAFSKVWKHRSGILYAAVGTLLAIAACRFIVHLRVTASLDATLRGLDLDDQRVQLIDELLIVFLGALVAALFVRRFLAPLAGASLFALISYIVPFVQHAQQITSAVTDVGVTQTILPGVLQHVTAILAALCVLAGVLGAAAGAVVGAITVGPLLDLCRALWALVRHAEPRPSKAVPLRAAGALAAALALVGLVSLAGASWPLWAFGIDSGLFAIQRPTAQAGKPATGTLVEGTYYSKALGRSEPYEVYLPPSYGIATAERYPTFYLLHGSPGEYTDWFVANGGSSGQVEDALLASGKMRETILASPDGNGPIYRASQWINSFDGRQRMEDAVAIDFVHFIDATYRTLPDPADRAIGGNSEGGYAAANIALHRPDVFGNAASVGGYFTILAGPPGLVGSGSGAATFQHYNSPSAFVTTTGGKAAARQLRFIVGVGSTDRYYVDGVAFTNLLKGDHVSAQLVTVVGGHSFSVWRGGMALAFQTFDPPDVTSAPSPTTGPTSTPAKSPTPTKIPT